MADFTLTKILGDLVGPSLSNYFHDQTVASVTWSVVHNLNDLNALIYFYDDAAKINIVSAINIDSNTTELTFSEPTIGGILVISPRPQELFIADITVPNTVITVEHNLNELYPVVQSKSLADGSVIPDDVRVVNANTVELTFSVSFTGQISVFSVSPEYSNVVRSVYQRIVASTSWIINHNHNDLTPIFIFYDENSREIYPDEVIFVDADTMVVNWAVPQMGSAIIASLNLIISKSCGTAGTGLDPNPEFAESFLYENTSTNTSITVVHDLNDILPLVEIYDDSGSVILANEVTVIDVNTVLVNLFEPQNCNIRVTTVQGSSAFISVQANPVNIWCIPHGLNDSQVMIQFYDLNRNKIVPQTSVNLNNNSTEATFLIAQAGYAKVVSLKYKINNVDTYLHAQPFVSNTWLINHNKRDNNPILAFYDLSGNYLIPDQILSVDENNTTATFLSAFRGYARFITTENIVPDVVVVDRFTDRFKSIVPFIALQFPEFARAYDYAPTSTAKGNILVTFMEAYYEWLERALPLNESQDNIQYQINNADLIFSLEYGVQRFFELYRNTYLQSIPYFFQNGTNVNPALLIKIIRSFYLTKGTKKAIKFLFNFLFNDPTAQISYVTPRLLTSAAATVSVRSYVRVMFTSDLSTDDNYKILLGQTLIGQQSFTRMTVQGFRVFTVGQNSVLEIEVSNISGELILGENLTGTVTNVVGDQTFTVTYQLIPYTIAGKFSIDAPGTGYEKFKTVSLATSGNGLGFSAQIYDVDVNGAITDLRIDDPGINYTVAPTLDLTNLGDGNATITIYPSIIYTNITTGTRYSGQASDIPKQQTITVFTDYTSRYTNLRDSTIGYTFYPTVEDFGPNKLHGVVVGEGMQIVQNSDMTDYGFAFTGVNDGTLSNGVSFGISNVLSPITPWTLEVKLTANLLSKTQSVIGKWGADSIDRHFVIQIDDNNRLVASAVMFGSTIIVLQDTVPLSGSTDYDIALVWDGTVLYLFKNGNFVTSAPFARMQLPSENVSFWLGRDDDDKNGNTPNPFSGTIYQARLSGVARYTTGYTPVAYTLDDDTISLYELNEVREDLQIGTGTIIASAPDEYTYYITSQTPISQYRDILKATVHPAGMRFVGRFILSSYDTNTHKAEMYHYYHPDDANFNNPLYSTSRFFKILTLKIATKPNSGDETLTAVCSDFNLKLKINPLAISERLGRVSVIDDYGPYLIDLFDTYTYPNTLFGNTMPAKPTDIDPNSPNRTSYESFGFYKLHHFSKYTRGGAEVTII